MTYALKGAFIMISTIQNVAVAFLHSPTQAAVSTYTCLAAGSNVYRDHSPQLFALYNKVQSLFVLVEGALSLGEAAIALDCQFAFFAHRAPLEMFFSSGAVFAAGGWIAVSYIVVRAVQQYFQDPAATADFGKLIPANLNGLSITVGPSTEDTWQQFCYVVRMTAAIALTVFGAQSILLCAVNVSCLGYGLYKLSQQNWMHIVHKYPDTDPNIQPHNQQVKLIQEVVAHYFFPLLVDTRQPQEDCPICLDDTTAPENPKYFYCPDKSYHLLCLPTLFFPKMPQLLDNWQYRRDVTIHRDKHGIKTGETVRYPSSIPRSNLPSCPDCRRDPTVDHQLYFTVNDTVKGNCESGRVVLRQDNPDQ